MDDEDEIDLFGVIGDDAAEDPRCFSSHFYLDWEDDVAKPALEQLGYHDIRFSHGDHDSFGPLVRIVDCTKNGEPIRMFYG